MLAVPVIVATAVTRTAGIPATFAILLPPEPACVPPPLEFAVVAKRAIQPESLRNSYWRVPVNEPEMSKKTED
jgi:hypothetical protein